MKRIMLAAALIFCAGFVMAEQYEVPFLNMTVPSGLEQNQMYFNFEHKFYQSFSAYPADDFFALLNNGANLHISLRYLAVAGLEVNAGYSSRQKEKTAGLSYTQKFPDWFFNAQAGVQYFSYEDTAYVEASQNFFISLALQTVPLLDDRLVFSLDAAYDGYNQTAGLAAGASFEIIKNLCVVAEYYPVFYEAEEDGNSALGTTGIFSAGLIYRTFGHQFIFKIGNSSEMGMRRLMLGTDNTDLYAGFGIMRLITF